MKCHYVMLLPARNRVGVATDTLVTKIILGTLGCLPAVDRFFIDGFKKSGNKYSYLNALLVKRMILFCSDCGSALRVEQNRIERLSGIRYPVMKLADMYFWESATRLRRLLAPTLTCPNSLDPPVPALVAQNRRRGSTQSRISGYRPTLNG